VPWRASRGLAVDRREIGERSADVDRERDRTSIGVVTP
jgi:hypothetical protein